MKSSQLSSTVSKEARYFYIFVVAMVFGSVVVNAYTEHWGEAFAWAVVLLWMYVAWREENSKCYWRKAAHEAIEIAETLKNILQSKA